MCALRNIIRPPQTCATVARPNQTKTRKKKKEKRKTMNKKNPRNTSPLSLSVPRFEFGIFLDRQEEMLTADTMHLKLNTSYSDLQHTYLPCNNCRLPSTISHIPSPISHLPSLDHRVFNSLAGFELCNGPKCSNHDSRNVIISANSSTRLGARGWCPTSGIFGVTCHTNSNDPSPSSLHANGIAFEDHRLFLSSSPASSELDWNAGGLIA